MKKNEHILVTGGLGYLGSHTVIELLQQNKKVIIVDNLSNSKKKMIQLIKKITKKNFIFFKTDIRSKNLNKIFKKYKIYSVIHFAGLKSVKESESKIDEYFDNNYFGSLNLLKIMNIHKCRKIIFSSSACVYDEKNILPFKENSKINPKSTYGLTKYAVEVYLRGLFKFDKSNWSIVILRYFNPIGSHPSALINEDPKKVENIIPNLVRSISKKILFKIYGGNYKTLDGTCYRDYIHVVDLVKAHLSSFKILRKKNFEIFNVGTGNPHSVKNLILEFSTLLKYQIPYKIVNKRGGDIPVSYACSKKISKKLNWKAKYDLNMMCKNIINNIKLI